MKEKETHFIAGALLGAFIVFIGLTLYNTHTYGRMSFHKHCDKRVEVQHPEAYYDLNHSS